MKTQNGKNQHSAIAVSFSSRRFFTRLTGCSGFRRYCRNTERLISFKCFAYLVQDFRIHIVFTVKRCTGPFVNVFPNYQACIYIWISIWRETKKTEFIDAVPTPIFTQCDELLIFIRDAFFISYVCWAEGTDNICLFCIFKTKRMYGSFENISDHLQPFILCMELYLVYGSNGFGFFHRKANFPNCLFGQQAYWVMSFKGLIRMWLQYVCIHHQIDLEHSNSSQWCLQPLSCMSLLKWLVTKIKCLSTITCHQLTLANVHVNISDTQHLCIQV